MNTRKVTALEEQILDLAVEWAGRTAAWDHFYDSGAWKDATAEEVDRVCSAAELPEEELLRLAKRLRKQREKAKQ